MSQDPALFHSSSAEIRGFSFSLLDGDHTLSKGLRTKVEFDMQQEQQVELFRREWPLLLADADHLAQINVPREEERLLRSGRALAQAWKKFQQELPKDERLALQGQAPNMSILFDAVKRASVKWQTNRGTAWGKTKSSFAKISRSAEDHSQLLAIIPNNDKYVALVCGSLTAVAKAAVNHDEIAEAVSESLAELCDSIQYWKSLVMTHRDIPSIQNDVRELYVVVFEFLTEIFTSWSASGLRRFTKSFDKNAIAKLFESKQKKIALLENKMRKAAEVHRGEKQNEMSLQFGKMCEMLRMQGGSLERIEQFQLLLLGAHQQHSLEDLDLSKPTSSAAGHALAPSSTGSSLVLPSAGSRVDENMSALDAGPQTYRRADIMDAVPIQEYIDRSWGDLIGRHDRVHFAAARQVVNRIARWTASNSDRPAALWIEGQSHVIRPSQSSLTALALAIAAKRSGFTTLSVFCTSAKRAPEMMNDFLRAIIAQLVVALPEVVTTSLDLTLPRFEACMLSGDDAQEQFLLLRDLRQLVFGSIVCVIAGAQALEDQSMHDHTNLLSQVMDYLCPVGTSDRAEGLNGKFCITTDGIVNVLARKAQTGALGKLRLDIEDGGHEGDEINFSDSISFSRD